MNTTNEQNQNLQILTQTDLANLKPDATIKNTHFENITWSDLELDNATFENCLFSNNQFAQADLSELYAYRCRFINCNFKHSKLVEANFDSCNFYQVQTDQGTDFSYSNLKHSKFLDCDLSQCVFKNADLFDITIKGCKIIAGNFEQANFYSKVSSKSMFAQAEIRDSILRFSRFAKIYLENCKLTNNDFTEADFTHANLKNCDLSHCILNNTSFVKASLEGADIQGAELNNPDLSQCILKGLKISIDQAIPFLNLFGIEVE